MPYVTRGAASLYYESHGAGPALVLAHGVGGNHASWYRQIGVFAPHYRVITFDHRAFGNSSDPEEVGRDGYVADLLALLDHLEIERALLVGQSMGGGTCAAFASVYPERVAALLLADSLAGVQLPEPLAGALAAVVRATEPLSQAERVLGPIIRADDPDAAFLYGQLASFNSVTAKTVRGRPPAWSPESLAAVAAPIQFLVGQFDVLFPPDLVRGVHERVPGSTYVEIAGAGHSAYFERPQAFNAALAAFLGAVDER